MNDGEMLLSRNTPMHRLWVTLSVVMTTTAMALAFQPQTPGEFVPVNQLPQAEQVPAAPLLIAAYAFVWVALLFYVWSVWRRLGRVERDMDALARRTQPGSSSR